MMGATKTPLMDDGRLSRQARQADLPRWAVHLSLRLAQFKQPGEYQFTLVVLEDGRRQLRVTPPPMTEELG